MNIDAKAMCLIGPVGVTFMLCINHDIGRNFHTDALTNK